MKGELFLPGMPAKKEELDRAEYFTQAAIRERLLDSYTAGALYDTQFGSESQPFEIIPGSGISISMGSGLGIGQHDVSLPEFIDASDDTKTGGDRLLIPLADTTGIPANAYANDIGAGPGTGTGTGSYTESADGLGGWTPTPQSTKTRNVPLVNGVMNYIWISYLRTIDMTVTLLHKISGKILYPKAMDGYMIVSNQVFSAPSGDPRYFLLGKVDLTGSPGIVTTALIDQALKQYAKMRPRRATARFNPSLLAPTVYASGTDIFMEDHINGVGTGTVTLKNVHGLTLVDLGFTEDIDLRTHRMKHHSCGLVVPNPSSVSSALYPATSGFTPIGTDAGAVMMYKPTVGQETAVVNGSVFDTVLDGVTSRTGKLASPIGGFPIGTWYASFGSSDASGVYGIVLYQAGGNLQIKKLSPVTYDPESEFLVCTVQWDQGAGDFVPATLIDYRLFGTIASRNIQTNAVETSNIKDLAATTAKLANNSVATDKIIDLNVTTPKINDLAVTTIKVADYNITSLKLGPDSVISEKIDEADGTSGQVTTTGSGVKAGHIQSGAITSPKIDSADGTSGQNVATGSGVKTGHIQKLAVESAQIALNDAGATAQDTTTGTGIKTDHIQGLAVTMPKLSAAVQSAISGTGKMIQSVYNQSNVHIDSTSHIPHDNTKPEKTEGVEVLTCNITPTSASNYLIIRANVEMTQWDTSNSSAVLALFKDDDTYAIAATPACVVAISNEEIVAPLVYRMVAGTTSSIIFKVRAGRNFGTITINGDSFGGPVYGGTEWSTISIEEITA